MVHVETWALRLGFGVLENQQVLAFKDSFSTAHFHSAASPRPWTYIQNQTRSAGAMVSTQRENAPTGRVFSRLGARGLNGGRRQCDDDDTLVVACREVGLMGGNYLECHVCGHCSFKLEISAVIFQRCIA